MFCRKREAAVQHLDVGARPRAQARCLRMQRGRWVSGGGLLGGMLSEWEGRGSLL